MPHAKVNESQRRRARQLRRAMIRAEVLLWRHLKAHQLAGAGFRQQLPVGKYIVDFVSHNGKLVIEIDGENHDFESRYRRDAERDAWLNCHGRSVLRFTNDDVLNNLDGVVASVRIQSENSPPSLSLPRKGRGDDFGEAGER